MISSLILGGIAAAAEICGGALVSFRKEWPRKIQEYLLALSAGFLLALVFFELVPESLALLGSSAPIYFILGYSMLHLFEHTIAGHFHFGEETHPEAMVSRTASYSAVLGLLVHAFFDGVSISAGMQYNPSIGFLIFIAVLLHKLPEGLTIASIMIAGNRSKKAAMFASFCVGTATLLGVVILFPLEKLSANVVGGAFAFSAGTAVYVGASDLIPEINKSGNRVIPIFVFGGMLLFYFTGKLLEGVV